MARYLPLEAAVLDLSFRSDYMLQRF